jgi:hypothetical protein
MRLVQELFPRTIVMTMEILEDEELLTELCWRSRDEKNDK